MAGEINAAMPQYVVDLITSGLNQMKKSVNGSNILVLGLSYKKDIADTRESPALDIITLLQTHGANISWNDPYISDYPNTPALTVVKDLTPSSLSTADCVVIITDHSSYDWASIVTHSHLIIDTRNATKNIQSPSGRVIKL